MLRQWGETSIEPPAGLTKNRNQVSDPGQAPYQFFGFFFGQELSHRQKLSFHSPGGSGFLEPLKPPKGRKLSCLSDGPGNLITVLPLLLSGHLGSCSRTWSARGVEGWGGGVFGFMARRAIPVSKKYHPEVLGWNIIVTGFD